MKAVIIGGDAAGLKTAARLRRLLPDADLVVLEKGDVISYAACGLPYFLSGDIDSFSQLVETAWFDVKDVDFFRDAKGIEVRTGVEALSVDRNRRVVLARENETGITIEFGYDKLVLATGAVPVDLKLPGCDLEGVGFFTRPDEAKALRKGLETGSIGRVAIIGAGYIGLELCEAFGALWGAEVVLIEKENHVLPMTLDRETASLVEKQLEEQGIELQLGVTVNALEQSGEGLAVCLDTGDRIEADRIIIAAGVRPRADLGINAGLEIGPNGGILVNDTGETSDPDIYAAGDCAELPHGNSSHLLPLGSIANRMGRVVANTIAGVADSMPELYGSAVVKVFDLNVGVCGKTAERAGMNDGKVEQYWASFTDVAHYYPESNDVHIKIVREKGDRLIGIQVIGKGEVVRWVNAFAQVMDLADGNPAALKRIEHAYAPPFATALDPLHNIAAMIEAGPDLLLPPNVLEDGGDPAWTVVNLLSEEETRDWTTPKIKGKWINITFRELRARAGELPRSNVVLLCARGPRSYEATIFLRSIGIQARYIAGGVVFS